MRRQGIWITGVGCMTSLGGDFATLAQNLLAGRSGVRTVERFDTTGHPCRIAALLPELPAPRGWDADDFHRRDRCTQLLLGCIVNALHDSGLWLHRRRLRIGLIVGIGAEWMQQWERDFIAGGQSVRTPESNSSGVVDEVRTALGLNGPFATVAAACASGNVALGVARQWLEDGLADVCLAGGADLGVSPMGLAGFGNLGALSKRNDAPQRACRPFDRDRDGFVMGEGAAVLVLEPEAHARRRSAGGYGAILGYAARSDAFHQVMPSSDATFAAAAMTTALADAGLDQSDVDYINAHATSTPAGDAFETKALHLAFGPALEAIPVSGTKSMTGHLLSAASAVEAVIGLIALARQAVPPTVNLDNVDPECTLRHVPHRALGHEIEVVLSNSFGFGGSNTALLLGQVPPGVRRAA